MVIFWPDARVILPLYKTDIEKPPFYLLFKMSNNYFWPTRQKGNFKKSMSRTDGQTRGWAPRIYILDHDTESGLEDSSPFPKPCCPRPCHHSCLHPSLSWVAHFWVLLWLGHVPCGKPGFVFFAPIRRRQTIPMEVQREECPNYRECDHTGVNVCLIRRNC